MSSKASEPSVDPLEFRNTLGRFGTGITVVTVQQGEEVRGITVNAFMSVSLKPPLVLVSIDKNANSHALLAQSERYGVSILSEHQEVVSNLFAGRPDASIEVHYEHVAGFSADPRRVGAAGLPHRRGARGGRPHALYRRGGASDLPRRRETAALLRWALRTARDPFLRSYSGRLGAFMSPDTKPHMQPLKGSIVPLPIPFTGSDAKIDEAALKEIIEFQLREGSHGLGVTGTTGEPSSLSLNERKHVAEFVYREVNGRVPVMPGTGTNNLDETLDLTKHAESIGADAVLVISPYYIKPNQNSLFEYFKRIADSVPNTPVVLYNIPGRTAVNIEPKTIGRLRDACKNIVGVKHATKNLDDVSYTFVYAGHDFGVYCGAGDDDLPDAHPGRLRSRERDRGGCAARDCRAV